MLISLWLAGAGFVFGSLPLIGMNFNDFMWLRIETVITNSMCTCQIYVYEKSHDQIIISLQEQRLTVPAAT